MRLTNEEFQGLFHHLRCACCGVTVLTGDKEMHWSVKDARCTTPACNGVMRIVKCPEDCGK